MIANNPLRLGGCLDATSAEKAARFVRMCDAFGVPLVVVVDVPGYLPGVGQEWDGVVRRGAKLLHAFAEAIVPRVTLVTRKAYGGAYIAMNSRALGATSVFAWPGAEVAVMGAVAAVRILHRRTLADVPPDKLHEVEAGLAAEHEREAGGLERASALGVIDEVIEPSQTRQAIAGPSRRRRSAAATTATSRCDGPGGWLRRDIPAYGAEVTGADERPGTRRLLVVEHGSHAPAGLLADWAAGRSLAIQTVALHAGEPLPAAPGCDAVVVLGSELTAYDDTLPWLAAELAFIERMLAASVPVLGICFGGQALARVLGARLYRLPVPEIGWAQVTSGHPGLAEGPWLSWHRDAFELPAGAAQIAANEVCVQGFSLRPACRAAVPPGGDPADRGVVAAVRRAAAGRGDHRPALPQPGRGLEPGRGPRF